MAFPKSKIAVKTVDEIEENAGMQPITVPEENFLKSVLDTVKKQNKTSRTRL